MSKSYAQSSAFILSAIAFLVSSSIEETYRKRGGYPSSSGDSVISSSRLWANSWSSFSEISIVAFHLGHMYSLDTGDER